MACWCYGTVFPWFCCWTLIRLSRHWAWLRRGYWCYRSLIDWYMNVVSHALLSPNIYRPPGPATAFFSEPQDILSYISTLPHELPLIGSGGTSIFELIPHHLVFWTLSTSTNTFILPTFTVILSTWWFDLRDATFSLFRPLIRFRTTFLLVVTCKFHPFIVGPSHKLSSTESYNQSTWKPSRLISKILIWLDIRKQMQLNRLYNMTVSSTLSSIFMPHWLPKRSL